MQETFHTEDLAKILNLSLSQARRLIKKYVNGLGTGCPQPIKNKGKWVLFRHEIDAILLRY